MMNGEESPKGWSETPEKSVSVESSNLWKDGHQLVEKRADEIRADDTASADEFFQQLNLSKSSGMLKAGQSSDRSSVIRKNPMTRYAHQALINSRKRKIGEKDLFSSAEEKPSGNTAKKKFYEPQSKQSLDEDRLPPEKKRPVGSLMKNSDSVPIEVKESGDVNVEKLVCEVCDFGTASKMEFKDHLESIRHLVKVEVGKGTDHHILKLEKEWKTNFKLPYKCSINSCNAQFIDWNSVLRHVREHSNSFPFNCTQCDSKFRARSDLVSHIKRHLGVKKIKCDLCEKTFEKSKSLAMHMIKMHDKEDLRPRNFKCTECGDAFLSKRGVDRHMRSHTGYRPEVCQSCSASFHTLYDLKDHMRIHSGEKPYSCDVCDFSTRTVQLLNRHKKRHQTEMTIKCKDCDFTCNKPGSLKRHSYLHSGKKPYKCPYCEHRCSDFENLKKHIKKTKNHRGLNIYPCTRCTYFSTDNGNEYLRHVKQYHFPHLDLKSSTPTKLAGIFIEENSQEDSEDEISPGSGNNFFDNDSESLLRDSDLPPDSVALSRMHPPLNALPELALSSTMEALNDLRKLDPNILNSVNRYDKGDLLLSSVASREAHDSRCAGAFSAPFDEESLVRPFTDTMEGTSSASTNQGCVSEDPSEPHTTGKAHAPVDTQPAIDMSQGYVAVLMKWPSNQKVEVQQGTAEGGAPLTLIVNNNPVLLRTAETESLPRVDDKATQSEEGCKSGSKTYIMSPNGLLLSQNNQAIERREAQEEASPI